MIDWGMGVGARRVKSAQGKIKILTKPNFSSELNIFLPSLGVTAHHWGAQPNIGGGPGTPKEI